MSGGAPENAGTLAIGSHLWPTGGALSGTFPHRPRVTTAGPDAARDTFYVAPKRQPAPFAHRAGSIRQITR